MFSLYALLYKRHSKFSNLWGFLLGKVYVQFVHMKQQQQNQFNCDKVFILHYNCCSKHVPLHILCIYKY